MLRLMWVQDYPFECENSNEREVSSASLNDDDAQNGPIHLSRKQKAGLATGRGVVVVSHGVVGERAFSGGALLFVTARPRAGRRKRNKQRALG